MNQTVSVAYDPAVSTWVVALTIPLGDDESITTLVSAFPGNDTETKIEAHAEARKLFAALRDHNVSRSTKFATVDDMQRAVISDANAVVPVPPQVFQLLAMSSVEGS
jgi:hypothetical protein